VLRAKANSGVSAANSLEFMRLFACPTKIDCVKHLPKLEELEQQNSDDNRIPRKMNIPGQFVNVFGQRV
jgi:hypothetical protein